MSSTGIDKARVDAFVNQGDGVRGHMESTLGATQRSVEDATSPAVWGGDASKAFGDVTARYQTASMKLNQAMADILNSVKAAGSKFENADQNNTQAINKVASGNVRL